MSTPVSVHTPRRTRRFSWPRIGFTEAQAAWAGRGPVCAGPPPGRTQGGGRDKKKPRGGR